jgi:hypothetical protein
MNSSQAVGLLSQVDRPGSKALSIPVLCYTSGTKYTCADTHGKRLIITVVAAVVQCHLNGLGVIASENPSAGSFRVEGRVTAVMK